MLTDTTDSSTASGQILAALTGRFAMPLLRSVQSLRRVAGGYVESDAVSSSAALPSANSEAPPPYMSPIRRLPPIPSSGSSPPPVPSIPRRYQTLPIAAQPRELVEAPVHQHRSTSLTSRPDNLPHDTIPRSVSLGATTRRVRPLPPVPPLPSSGQDVSRS
ncbi:hypothetical protein FS749_007702 [Ceratobasidium sp. UAMH 11750]|nr:hypothetical protein FS749_007702 [Ceratobasidium sp. UAMH 11750]